jgi:hypothetical protein
MINAFPWFWRLRGAAVDVAADPLLPVCRASVVCDSRGIGNEVVRARMKWRSVRISGGPTGSHRATARRAVVIMQLHQSVLL